jgi:hypothetical protein
MGHHSYLILWDIHMTEDNRDTGQSSKDKGGILGTLQTILGAVFGVQSDKKRQEDFAKADPGKLIALGIITVIVIMVAMAITVNTVLDSAGR